MKTRKRTYHGVFKAKAIAAILSPDVVAALAKKPVELLPARRRGSALNAARRRYILGRDDSAFDETANDLRRLGAVHREFVMSLQSPILNR